MDSFNEEFKKMIVQMYLDGESVSDLSRKYEVSRPSVYNWIRQFKPIQLEDGKTTDVSDIIKLKQEMIKLKEENEVLKKCITIFSKKQ
ncbi:MAG: transposase [Erysipelothrix sp.]|nr:transposase [Erysipelothrix sp.]